ncbi:MAG: hypothetical protein EBY55_13200 [Gammaproteobacteria bacterium]|nr:hypothetical protein [Gammaproteobacteria bacterium]
MEEDLIEEVLPPDVFSITLVSGAQAQVMSEPEQEWFEEAKDNYLQQTRFTDQTDQADLDRLLNLELLTYRWSQWLFSGHDYQGLAVDETDLSRKLRDQSETINRLKSSLGLTKAARNQDAASVSERWSQLKERAKAFGIHREEQLRKALVLVNELSSIVGTFDRSDKEEREKIGFQSEKEIVDWIRETMLPEFKALDEHFREQQKFWRQEDA